MCKDCQLRPVYEFTNKRKLCGKCFIRYFQKKVLYVNRKFGMIRKGDIVFIKGRNDFRKIVLKHVLEEFKQKFMIRFANSISNKIAIPSTIDSEANEIIHILIQGKIKNLKKVAPIEKKIIKPLYLFLDKEVLLYAKLKKLKFKKKMEKKDKINSFIDELENKHPEVKRAIVSSYLKMYN